MAHIWPPRSNDQRIIDIVQAATSKDATPDDVFKFFRSCGYTGSLDDMWRQYLRAEQGTCGLGGITDTSEPFDPVIGGDPFFGDVILIVTATGITVNRTGGSGSWNPGSGQKIKLKEPDLCSQTGTYVGIPRVTFNQPVGTPDPRACSDDQSLSWADRSLWADGATGATRSFIDLRKDDETNLGLGELGTAWNWGTNDMTWEGHVWLPSSPSKLSQHYILAAWGQGTRGSDLFQMGLEWDGTNGWWEGFFSYSSPSSAITPAFSQAGSLVPDDDWHHIAVCRKDITDWSLWFDGQLQATATNGLDFKNAASDHYLQFQSWFSDIGAATYYWDNARITRACRYTENFTPPSRAYEGADNAV
jgi:hypothetical protein